VLISLAARRRRCQILIAPTRGSVAGSSVWLLRTCQAHLVRSLPARRLSCRCNDVGGRSIFSLRAEQEDSADGNNNNSLTTDVVRSEGHEATEKFLTMTVKTPSLANPFNPSLIVIMPVTIQKATAITKTWSGATRSVMSAANMKTMTMLMKINSHFSGGGCSSCSARRRTPDPSESII
jgi:hypothetical protein